MPATVLICENEAPLRALMRASLEENDYEILEAPDGDAALELARSRRPEVVLLDVMMPGRSGLDVLRELRRDPELSETRIVMVTARIQPADRAAAIAEGADVFLAKPFSPLELAAVVAELVERDR